VNLVQQLVQQKDNNFLSLPYLDKTFHNVNVNHDEGNPILLVALESATSILPHYYLIKNVHLEITCTPQQTLVFHTQTTIAIQ